MKKQRLLIVVLSMTLALVFTQVCFAVHEHIDDLGLNNNNAIKSINASCGNHSGELNDKLLAERQNANLNKSPHTKQLGQQFDSLNQFDLQNNLALFILEQDHTTEGAVLAKRISDKGYCYAFTTLWLYSKWLQYKQPQKSGGYNQNYDKDWFDTTIKKISLLDQHQSLSFADIADIKKFAQQLDFMMFPRHYIEGFRPADTKIHETDNRLTTDGKILREQYKIAAKFYSQEKLVAVLKNLVREDVLIYLVSSNDDIENPGHFVGLFKHDNKYYYYNPLSNFGEIQYNSIEEIVNHMPRYMTAGSPGPNHS